jgi:putative membrane protein
MDDGWQVVMAIGMFGLWAVIAVALAWVIRSTRTAYAPPSPPRAEPPPTVAAGVNFNAERILAERLARGEIDTDEFRTRLEVLSSQER